MRPLLILLLNCGITASVPPLPGEPSPLKYYLQVSPGLKCGAGTLFPSSASPRYEVSHAGPRSIFQVVEASEVISVQISAFENCFAGK